jgi:hypothetical protein
MPAVFFLVLLMRWHGYIKIKGPQALQTSRLADDRVSRACNEHDLRSQRFSLRQSGTFSIKVRRFLRYAQKSTHKRATSTLLPQAKVSAARAAAKIVSVMNRY